MLTAASFAVFFFPIVWVLLFPLGRAYLDGIAAARDPSNRVTPQSGWYFFDAMVRRRLRRWLVIWTTLLLASLSILTLIREFYFWDLWGSDISLGLRLAASGVLTELFMALGLMLWAAIVILAPRVKSLWALMTLALISAFPPLALFSWIAIAAVPSINDADLAAPLIPLALAAASVFVVRLWARRRGDAWFCLDE